MAPQSTGNSVLGDLELGSELATVWSGSVDEEQMRKTVSDLSTMAEQLRESQLKQYQYLVDLLARQMQPMIDLQKQTMQAAEQIAAMAPSFEMLSGLAESMMEPLQKTVERFAVTLQRTFDEAEVASEEVAPLLEKGRFWFTPSMPLWLIGGLRELAAHGQDSAEDVAKLFIEYYEQDDWAPLRDMVSGWQGVAYFDERQHIIQDALDAHLQGKYTLVVPALLAQIEGIASAILGVAAGSPKQLIESTIEDEHTDVLRAASKDALITFVTSQAGYARIEPDDFTPDRFPKWLEATGEPPGQSMNRHAVLHGVHVNYNSKENSLRVFLLLDAFYYLGRAAKESSAQN